MSSKSKGIQAERELIHLFWGKGWASMRVAGSGSSSFPSPDIIASNSKRILALECKTLKKGKKYLEKETIEQLKEFAGRFGAEPWLAMRFNREPWFFLGLEELEKTGSCWAVSQEWIKEKGISFERLINQPKDLKEQSPIFSAQK